jgi:hypothetical protein
MLNRRWVVALVLMFLAGALRFHKLGDWAFANDELSTIGEERALFERGAAAPESQAYRLPRVIPLSYFFHRLGDSLFGRDEFGSRVVTAVFGTLGIGIVFLLLDMLKGRATALACALLMALWPEHIFQSQQTRFYIIAAFFAGLAMLLGAFAAQRRSALSAAIACCAIFAAILCHTLTAILLGTVFAGIVAGSYAARQPFPKKAAWVFLAAWAVAALFGWLYLKPLMSGWNSGETWGYGVLHSLLASVNAIGWPVALLAALGVLVLLRERSAQNWYWATCALGWLAASAVLPRLVVYHPGYAFPLAVAVFVVAGCAVGTIHDCLKTKGTFVAAAWVGLACLGNLPGVASHYRDGSRHDIRTAAEYVKTNWQPGDRVAGHAMAWFAYYAKDLSPAISKQPDLSRELEDCVHGKQRLWVVVESGRGGLPKELDQFLGTHCSHEFKVLRPRFDYAEYCVDVYLYRPKGER